jgi:hypothetical protein
MDNTANTENTVETPLLKEKRTRPPQSEKQKEAFKKARERLLEKRAQTKQEKILDAKRSLLEKEGLLVKTPAETLTPQFDINEDEPLEPTKAPAPNTKRAPPSKAATGPLKEAEKRSVGKAKKKEPRVILSESEDDDSGDSSSSEEVIVIKRSRKPKAAKHVQKKEESDEEETYSAPTNYMNYFC